MNGLITDEWFGHELTDWSLWSRLNGLVIEKRFGHTWPRVNGLVMGDWFGHD